MADNILKLKVDSTEYDAKLKRASDGLTRYVEGCRKAGGTLEVVEKDTLAYVKALGNMETTSRTAKGKLAEMTKAFTDLSMQYKQLTAQEQGSPFGKAMAQSLETLKGRINSYKSQLGEVGKSIGETENKSLGFKDALDIVGSKLGINANLMEVVTTGHLGMAAAIGAGVTAVAKAVEAFAEYNEELEKNKTIASVTTGLSGEAAGEMAEKAEALAKVYGVDFREVINAANTLMQQFGKTGEESVELVRKGLQGMLEGDGPKLLTMIQQYAPAFRDAGISASQLVAIIHNSEGGIFTDANMNAIVMGIKNIRLMTKATNDALAKIGVDGNEITKELENGTINIFQAMQMVLTKLGETKSGSQAAGEVMQQVFGRQGVNAGTNIAKAINTLNLNLEETRKQTGEIGDKQDELYKATLRLNTALKECFGVESFASFKKALQTDVVNALARVLELVDEIKRKIQDVGARANNIKLPSVPGGKDYNVPHLGDGIRLPGSGHTRPVGKQKAKPRSHTVATYRGKTVHAGQTVNGLYFHWDSDKGRMVGTRIRKTVKPQPKKHNPVFTNPHDNGSGGGRSGGHHTTRTTHTPAKVSSIKPETEEQLNSQKISALTEEYVKATDTRRAAIKQEIADLQKRNDEIKKLKDEAQGKVTPKVDYSQLTGDNLSKVIADLNKQINQSEIGGTLYNKLTEKLKDANTFKDVLQIAIQNGIDLTNPDFSKIWQEALNADNISDDDLQKLVDDINQKLAGKGLGQISIKAEGGASLENPQPTEKKDSFEESFSNIKEGWSDISGIGDGINSMTQALEGNANGWEKLSAIINGFIHISDGIMDVVKMVTKLSAATKAAGAVSAAASKTAAAGKTAESAANAGAATTAAADTMASATAGAAKLPFPASIAAIAAAIAATVGIIATIASLTTGFHHGGVVHAALGAVVPGTNYSGDMVPAMLNSGELVLNQAQQGNLASQLASAGSFRDLRLGMDVDGDVLRLVLNNNGRRTGKGELVTSNIKLW